jgi:hypothetical protein
VVSFELPQIWLLSASGLYGLVAFQFCQWHCWRLSRCGQSWLLSHYYLLGNFAHAVVVVGDICLCGFIKTAACVSFPVEVSQLCMLLDTWLSGSLPLLVPLFGFRWHSQAVVCFTDIISSIPGSDITQRVALCHLLALWLTSMLVSFSQARLVLPAQLC